MLQIKDLCVSYEGTGKPVLDRVDLTVEPGKMAVLIGRNGSGKTTLLRGITGLMHPLSGSILYDGSDLIKTDPRERARLIAIVPQASELPAGYTVFETVSHGRTPYLNWCGMLGEKDREIIEAAIRATGLSALQDKEIRTLSGGEQQRVILARALAQDAPVLIMDEPTSYLDLYYQVILLDLVRSLCKEKQLAVLTILHDLNLAARYADTIAILDKGRIIADGAPESVLKAETLTEVFGTPVKVLRDPAEGLIILPAAR